MKPISVMLIAGEASGDAHAAELVQALRSRLTRGSGHRDDEPQPLVTSLVPRFFGAGGPCMAAAGVELDVDLVAHAVFGLVEVVEHLGEFRRLLHRLLVLARRRQPDVIVLVDYAGFNRRFAAAVRRGVRAARGPFANWRPRLVYFISPQVWASRGGRAKQLERDLDLLLSIIPFEKAWYARRAPRLRVEFVGHPLVDRLDLTRRRVRREEHGSDAGSRSSAPGAGVGWGDANPAGKDARPTVILLPGSRAQEVRRHLPIMAEAVRVLQRTLPIRPWMVLPTEQMLDLAMQITPVRRVEDLRDTSMESAGSKAIACRIGGLSELLARADLAIAKSGTVTLECACFRVPTVVMYRVAWATYWIARMITDVPFIAMPNLLANRRVFPEFIQGDATPERLAAEAADLLNNPARRAQVRRELDAVVAALGPPGACERAAEAIAGLLR